MSSFNPIALLLALGLLYSGPAAGQVSLQFVGSGVATPKGAVWIVSGDFNGDGNADVATANAAAGSISVFLGNGDGTFKAPVDYAAPSNCQPNYLAAGDFNNDHKLDLLGSCIVETSVFVLPGLGDGRFGQPVNTPLPENPFIGFLAELFAPAAIADFNGDGKLDIAIQAISNPNATDFLNSTNTLVLLGRGDGSFQASTPLSLGGQSPIEVASADFNGDGKPDLAVISVVTSPDGTGGVNVSAVFLQIGLGDGKGNFSFLTPVNIGTVPDFAMIAGDINGDGKPDLILAGPSLLTLQNSGSGVVFTGVVTLLGRGDGTFQQTSVTADPSTEVPVTLTLVDIENKGTLDLVAADLVNSNGTTGGVSVYRNQGSGILTPELFFPEPAQTAILSAVVVDVNGDGRPDVIPVSINAAALQNISGSALGIQGIQQVLAQFPTATVQFMENQTLPLTFTNANAATFKSGPLATSSIVAAFGAGLAPLTGSAPGVPLPTSLGGVSISVTDSGGVTRAAPLFYASPKQVNFEIPDGTATGVASVGLTTSAGTVKVSQQVVSTSGGIFNAQNIAAGDVYTYSGTATPVVTGTIAVNSQDGLIPEPIDVGTGAQQVFLILFGTGVRNHASAVTATIGAITGLPVAYAGAQGVYVGEDQINILLPQSLRGAGLVNVTLNVDGLSTNPVQIQIQ